MEVLVIQYTWPILIVIFSIFILKEKLNLLETEYEEQLEAETSKWEKKKNKILDEVSARLDDIYKREKDYDIYDLKKKIDENIYQFKLGIDKDIKKTKNKFDSLLESTKTRFKKDIRQVPEIVQKEVDYIKKELTTEKTRLKKLTEKVTVLEKKKKQLN